MDAVGSQRPDLRRERGARTRRAILEKAARLSSVEGLEGLSIGRLADHLAISKSGLYAHFRSKEELQLATIRTAEAMYDEALVQPALAEAPGTARVIRFADLYLDYLRDGPFPGGCFFIAASIDPARNRGPVKEALAESQRVLLDFFANEIATAQVNGEAPAGTDPRQVAFEIDALLAGADLNYLLFDDPEYLERAKRAVRVLLVHTDDATR
jgi:AcrR family transcriptional regulator